MKQRIMALDIGDARIGVAISDPMCITAQPHSSIEASGAKAIKELLKIIIKEGVGKIVVGLPKELSGNIGEQGKKILAFKDLLLVSLSQTPANSSISVELWDERMTTAQAERIIAGSGLKNRDRRKALDRISAAVILESYLLANPKI